MISVNDIYQPVVSLAQKAQHGTVRVADFNRYATMASQDLFNERLGSDRDFYKLGKGMAKTSAGMDKQVDQSLRVFYVPDASVAVTGGLATIPADMEFIDKIVYAGTPIKWVPNNKFEPYQKSTIDVPTVDYPIYTDLNTQIKVSPSSMTPVLFSYYKTPANIVWNYTLVSGRPVFNPTGSTNFEWISTEKNQLIMRILGYIGITIRESELVQYSNSEENTIA